MNRRFTSLFLAGVLALSAALNLWGVAFPLGYHYDEPKKVEFMKTGRQDFHHPILMLELTRAANAFLGFQDDQDVAVLGRVITACSGALVVAASYWLARLTMSSGGALVAAAGVAVSPILVIHAHYFKEDTLFTCWALFSLVTFMRFIERPRPGAAFWLGLCLGLAAASHYKALLLAILYCLFPAFAPGGNRVRRYALLGLALAVAAYLFLLVNWPLIDDPATFLDGVRHDARHVVSGHELRIGPLAQYFTFHLRNSLLPGLTPPVAILGVLCVAHRLLRWTRTGWRDKLLIDYVLLFYFVPEISPLKPAPDFARYMLPVAPVLIYFAYQGLLALRSASSRPVMRRSIEVCCAVTLIIPFCDTARLDYYMTRDTRTRAAQWLASAGGQAVFEAHSAAHWDVPSAAQLDLEKLRQRGVAYVVASSFQYDRYFRGAAMTGQPARIYRRHNAYLELFSHPYVEFSPAYKSFAFSNPTIRIVDIRPNGASAPKPPAGG